MILWAKVAMILNDNETKEMSQLAAFLTASGTINKVGNGITIRIQAIPISSHSLRYMGKLSFDAANEPNGGMYLFWEVM